MTTDLIDWGAITDAPHAAGGATGAPPVALPRGLDHLSASSISQYLRCPRQWALVRILGMRVPPDGGLVSGSAVHKGAEHGMRGKAATGRDPNVAEVTDVARDEARKGLERSAREAEETGLTEHLAGDAMKSGTVVDKAARLTEKWATDAAPRVQPATVEEDFEAVLGGIRVTGRLDVVEQSGAVRDWKTSGKTPNAEDVASTVQTEMYAAITGREVNYTYLIDTARSGVKVVDVEVPREDLERASRLATDTVTHVAAAIAAGSFPRKRDGWQCSQKWCAFFRNCLSGNYDERLAEAIPEYLAGAS